MVNVIIVSYSLLMILYNIFIYNVNSMLLVFQ